MAQFLITGVAGFIGSSLAHELLRQGHNVRGVDNLACGDIHNLDPILDSVDFYPIDINDTARLRECCRGVDYVLHQAALASVPQSVKDPLRTHLSNVDGTLSVLLAARDAGVSRVVYAASSSAYGDQPAQPKHEAMIPSPISPYGAQKLAGEHYIKAFWRAYELEAVSLRYFNVFGPRQRADSPYSGVIARFVSDMLEGRPSTIFGTGEQSRDFTFIDNVVCANLLACFAPAEEVAGEVFNIGTGESQSLNTLYQAIADLLNCPCAARYGAARAGDIEHSEADISRARQALGYFPLATFRQGLRSTIEWYSSIQAKSGRVLQGSA